MFVTNDGKLLDDDFAENYGHLQDCQITFSSIPISPSIMNVKSVGKLEVESLPVDKYLQSTPQFSMNGRDFIIGQSTFSDIVNGLLDYITNQSIDGTIRVKPNQISELAVNDGHGLKIYMKFKNIRNVDTMRESSILQQFMIERSSDNRSELTRFSSYIPFGIIENQWCNGVTIEPCHKVFLNDIHCYKYKVNNNFVEVWFSANTSQLVAIIAGKQNI